MAKPRVFISSTFYDLKHVRADLERFIREMGYDPIRHETGSIPYSREAPLEESAYQEVTQSDIIVCVVGGRYGSDSSTRDGSITQNELQEALKKGIQVYIFVEQNVLSEYATFQVNKENENTNYRYVDNPAVYSFLEEVYALPQNNPITSFTTSSDIASFLKLQWAGLFQKFLQEQKRISELEVLEEMTAVASTLKDLVNFLTEERKNSDDAIKNIILANHPAFRAFAKITNTRYRVFFTNREELDNWLLAQNFSSVSDSGLDGGSTAEWTISHPNIEQYIKLTHKIFDENDKLIPITDNEWNDSWLKMKESWPPPVNPMEPPMEPPQEDEIPF